jgi:hypothetical protein
MAAKEQYLAGSSGAGYTKLLTQALGEGKRDHKGESTSRLFLIRSRNVISLRVADGIRDVLLGEALRHHRTADPAAVQG